MKKTLFIFGLLAISVAASAQLKVTSSGNVGVALSNPVAQADLSVSGNDGYNYSSYAFGIRTERQGSKYFNLGIAGRSKNSALTGRSIGVQGVASGGQAGWRFGVIGGLADLSGNGAGIFGTTLEHVGVQINGRYAGYFNGHVYVDSTITATSLITPSDMRLKENVQAIGESASKGVTLENLLSMNVIKYHYKERARPKEVTDTLSTPVASADRQQEVTHYGLSAQELQQIYPDLVYEGQDGYLGINYVELVPILIRSIQELKAELDEVKGAEGSSRKALQTNDVARTIANQAQLLQNTPNPFTERTEIRFSLPDDVNSAYIYIFDMTGKMLRQIPVDSSMQSVVINGYELSAGIYLYSLVINGQEIDTKRMILSK